MNWACLYGWLVLVFSVFLSRSAVLLSDDRHDSYPPLVFVLYQRSSSYIRTKLL